MVAAASIIVPTYGEAPNIEPLVERAFAALAAAHIEAEMIIVDDDSRDGTCGVVEALAERHAVRIIVRRDRRGLASAVLDGFAAARHDVLAVMDADLQHPPEILPQLVTPIIEDRADFVIGSRYVAGGSVARRWGLLRRVNSRVATLLARPLVPLADPMSGLFAVRRETWLRARKHVNPVGYKIALELAVKSRCRRFAEVPIAFATRHAGDSKLSAAVQVGYLIQLADLYAFRFFSRRPARQM